MTAAAASGLAIMGEGQDEHYLDRKSQKYNHRGLREPDSMRQLRQENRNHTLAQIDQVLQDLNTSTAVWTDPQPMEGANGLGGETGRIKSERERMREMQKFAKPFSGISSLMKIVDEVTEEFNS